MEKGIKKGVVTKVNTRLWLAFVIGAYLVLKAGMYATGRVFFDEGIYISIARYFAAFGEAGYFEHLRPLLLPAVLSPFQLLPFDSLVSGRAVMVLLTVLCVLLVYRVSYVHFGCIAARWSALLFAMSASVVFLGGLILTDVIAFTLPLLAASLAWRNKPFLSGCALGAAFLFKFPALFAILPISALFIYRHKLDSLTRLAYLAGGVMMLAAPYFIFNLLYYDGALIERALRPLLDAGSIVRIETWLYEKSSMLDYLIFLLVIELPLVVSSALALRKTQKGEQGVTRFLALCALSFLLYFSLLVVRLDYRYMLSVIPFLAVIGGAGLSKTVGKAPMKSAALMAIFIAIIPVILALVLLAAGTVQNTVTIPKADQTTFTNSGQALLHVKGPAELCPGPNMGRMYLKWRLSKSSDLLVIDLDGYPCQESDNACKEEKRLHISRLLTTNRPVECGMLYGEDTIILSKRLNSTLTKESCIARLKEKNYAQINSRAFIRLSAAVLTEEGRLQNMEGLTIIVQELSANKIPATLVITASNSTPDDETRRFITGLASNMQLGVLPRQEVYTNNFISRVNEATGKSITVIASPTDDWVGRAQDFPAGITSCIRASWDQTAMKIPCLKIDLFTVSDWNNDTMYDEEYLYQSYEALTEVDSEVGIDIPVPLLKGDSLIKMMSFIERVADTEKG